MEQIEQKQSFFKVMKVVLKISMLGLIVSVIGAIITAFIEPEIDILSRINNVIMSIVGGGLILYILMSLEHIVKTVEAKAPFVKLNIQKLNNISYCIFSIAFLYFIATYPLPSDGGIQVLATPYGSVKVPVFILIILGCIALLLAEIFSQAMKIKEENDMTI